MERRCYIRISLPVSRSAATHPPTSIQPIPTRLSANSRRPTLTTPWLRSQPPKVRFPHVRDRPSSSVTQSSRRPAMKSWPASSSLGHSLPGKREKPFPGRSEKPSAPRKSSTSSRARPCAYPEIHCHPFGPASVSRSPRRPSASSGSLRLGTFRSPSPLGKSRRHCVLETRWSSNLPTSFPPVPGPWSKYCIARVCQQASSTL